MVAALVCIEHDLEFVVQTSEKMNVSDVMQHAWVSYLNMHELGREGSSLACESIMALISSNLLVSRTCYDGTKLDLSQSCGFEDRHNTHVHWFESTLNGLAGARKT